MPPIPASALEQLKATHDLGCALIREGGAEPEPVEVAIEVEEHRWHWRPDNPKLVLVAESHVYTSAQDADLRLSPGAVALNPPPPASYVRLIYCVGYGEPELVPGANFNKRGTPPFWDLFGRVTFRGSQPRAEDGFPTGDRLRWKVQTLQRLQAMGIWLLDASVHAIYRGNGDRLDSAKAKLHQQWWEGYGRFTLQRCNDPKVWVVGKGVFDCLSSLDGWRCDGWVYQPHVKGVDLNRNWPGLLEDCWRFR
jgi:hypothetical protein